VVLSIKNQKTKTCKTLVSWEFRWYRSAYY